MSVINLLQRLKRLKRLTRFWESTHRGELRIDVEGVIISRESVDEGLLKGSLLLEDRIGFAIRRVVDGSSSSSIYIISALFHLNSQLPES